VAQISRSVALFVLAGLCEIAGGYLVWQWWRNGAHLMIGLLGAATLILYGIVPTYQPAHFGRVYAAYGGWFVVLSILWGWGIDRVAPDRYVGGLPELFALAADWGRAALGEALGWLQARGGLTLEEARAAGARILSENARTLYGLPAGPTSSAARPGGS
jgi:small multidrug resistance family-3 protein